MITYNSIGSDFVQRTKLSEMSKQDKFNLLNDLLYDLGFVPKIVNDPVLGPRFDATWLELINKP